VKIAKKHVNVKMVPNVIVPLGNVNVHLVGLEKIAPKEFAQNLINMGKTVPKLVNVIFQTLKFVIHGLDHVIVHQVGVVKIAVDHVHF
jgi:hypothetical protein